MKKILCASLLLFAACSSSKITTSWTAQHVQPKKYNKVLVVGLIRESDRSIREKMENHFVGDLSSLGYKAVSSLAEYGPKAFDNLSEEEMLRKLGHSGVDAVLTIVLLDKDKERKYIPGQLYYSPYGYYQNRLWGYYGVLNRRIYEQGYYVTSTNYFWETNLYDQPEQKLVYSSQTKTFDPSSTESMGHEYGKMIVKDMVKKNVLMEPIKLEPIQ
jgi:hypothetical protein